MYQFCLALQYLGILILLFEIFYIYRQKSSKLQLLMLTVAVSTLINFLGYLLEMRSTAFETALQAVKILYLGKPYIFLGNFLFVIEYYKIKIPSWLKGILLAFHMSITVLVWNCEKLPWYYSSLGYTQEGLFPHLVLGKGFVYIAYHAFMIGYVVVIMLLGIIRYRKAFSPKERENILCLSGVSVMSCIGFAVYLTGVTKGYDSTLPAYVISTTLLFISMRRYNLLDPMDFVRENVMDDLADGLAVLDREEQLIYTNPMVRKVFPELCTEQYRTALEELEHLSGQDENTVKDGRVYHVRQKEIVRDQTIYGKMYVVADITESYQYTIQLEQQKAIAEQASHAKGDFLVNMSHEIRTPINAVLGMNEMILREAKDEEILTYASHAYDAGKVLLSLINDVLDISKIEAGKLEIVEAEYDLQSLVNDCYNMTADRAGKKNLQYIFSIEETLPSLLCGDMVRIRQIIMNLLTNAIKYTDEGSVEFTVTGQTDGEEVLLRFEVADTGIGLTEESLENLFDTFRRFDLQHNQSVEGTGLGLSICKQLAELMGGEIQVESVYGKGSTFRCVIPQKIISGRPIGKMVLGHNSGSNAVKSAKRFTARGVRILVVDDVEMNLIVFTSLTKGHGLLVETAQSGKQCLEMIRQQKYDIIFMDHMMPEMDGMETFARMKETEHENRETPVIMLTANAISGEKEKYLSAGFAFYLTKPIQSEKLDEVLLRYLPEEKVSLEETAEQSSAGVPDIQAVCADRDFFDADTGIGYMGGDIDAYYEILASYVRGGEAGLDRIEAFYEQEAWRDYVTKVHALKSSSLTVGFKLLSKLAAELEQAGKEGSYELIREKNSEMLEMYRKALKIGEEVLAMLHPDTNVNSTGTDTRQSAALRELTVQELEEYREALENAADNFDVDGILSAGRALAGCSFHGVCLGELFRGTIEAAEDFEYEQAKEYALQAFERLLNGVIPEEG